MWLEPTHIRRVSVLGWFTPAPMTKKCIVEMMCGWSSRTSSVFGAGAGPSLHLGQSVSWSGRVVGAHTRLRCSTFVWFVLDWKRGLFVTRRPRSSRLVTL